MSDRQWCEQVCSLPSFPLSLLPYTAPCAAPCSGGCTHIQLLLQLLIQLLLPLTACQDCQLQEKCFHRLSRISQGGNVDLIPISDNFGPAGKNTINQKMDLIKARFPFSSCCHNWICHCIRSIWLSPALLRIHCCLCQAAQSIQVVCLKVRDILVVCFKLQSILKP